MIKHRLSAIVIAAALGTVLIAGCGSSSSGKTQNTDSTTSAAAPAASFPRSVKHAMGTAEISLSPSGSWCWTAASWTTSPCSASRRSAPSRRI